MSDVMNRRSFLGGALALSAFVVLPATAGAEIPRIVGDGVHNDAPGLQALLDGKPAMMGGSIVQVEKGGLVKISGGAYRLGSTVTVRDGCRFHASNFAFIGDEPVVLNCERYAEIRLNDGIISSPSATGKAMPSKLLPDWAPMVYNMRAEYYERAT